MALCLRRNLRSGASFVFVFRRNQQTCCFDQRSTSNAPELLFKEINRCDFNDFTIPRNINFNSNAPRLQASVENSLLWRDLYYVPLSKDLTLHDESNVKLNYLKLECDTVFCAKQCTAPKERLVKYSDNIPGKPEPQQVQNVFNTLSEDLPKLFYKTMNYDIYHPDIIFENNIRGTKTIGVNNYAKQIAILKTVGHLKYAQVSFDILKITAHPEDGTVRVRWRIRGVPNYKAFFSFIWWFWNTSQFSDSEGWYDGFSVFYVRSDGLIHKHLVDKMIPDMEEKIQARRSPLATKMAFAIGVKIKDLFHPFN